MDAAAGWASKEWCIMMVVDVNELARQRKNLVPRMGWSTVEQIKC